MKTYSLLRNFSFLILVLILANAAQVRAAAQETAQSTLAPPIQKPLAPYALVIENGFLSTIPLDGHLDLRTRFPSANTYSSFVEAKLGILVDVLRDLHTNANIVVEPSLANLKISDLKIRLRNGSDDRQLQEELSALQVASGNKFRWEQPGVVSGIDPLTGQPVKAETSSSLYVLSPDLAAAASVPRRVVEVFNLAGYIQGEQKEIDRKLDRITDIVTTTVMQLKGAEYRSEDEVVFKFHSGANLLIATGPQESIEVARKVVNALLGHAGMETRARNVLVLGAVFKPGSVALPDDGKITILDAIGLAGGTTKLANEKKIEFTHDGKSELYSFENLKRMIDQKQIIYLEPGDIIKVHESHY